MTAPTGTNATIVFDEDTSHVLTLADFGFHDADGHTLASVTVTSLPAAGRLWFDSDGAGPDAGFAVMLGQVVSAADIIAGRISFIPDANQNGDNYATMGFRVRDSAGTNAINTNTLRFRVTSINDLPVLDLNGAAAGTAAALAYVEENLGVAQGTASRIAPSAALTDLDQGNYDGGTLTVSFTSGATADDLLVVASTGTGTGQIAVAGSQIRYQNVVIGSYTVGDQDSPLVATFNSAATVAAVRALIAHIAYRTDSHTPVEGTRGLEFTVADGDGGTSTGTATVQVTAADDYHGLDSNGAAVLGYNVPMVYIEGSAAKAIAPGLEVDDPDSTHIAVTTLRVFVSAPQVNATDQLVVLNQGTGVGQVGVMSGIVRYGGAAIGTVSGGGDGTDLLIDFYDDTIPIEVAQAVLRAIGYFNTSDTPPTAPRPVLYELNHPGGFSVAYATVSVIASNDAPTIANVDGSFMYTEGQAAERIDTSGDAIVSDPDSADFGGGTLSAEITFHEMPGEDVLGLDVGGSISLSGLDVLVGGVTVGTIVSDGTGGNPFAVSLNANATPARVQELVRAITYANTNDLDPTTSARTVTVTLNDGDGIAAGGDDETSTAVVVNLWPLDDPRGAADDSGGSVAENATLRLDVLANDVDIDGGPSGRVIEIAGIAVADGQTVTLASGARVTLNVDRTLTYDPNRAFNYLVAAGTGAANTSATDSFAYAINGGDTANVTVTITGVQSIGDQQQGDAGDNVITGTAGANLFMLHHGGTDTVSGGGGEDGFYMGAALDATDTVDGGTFANTSDQLGLQGNYDYVFSATNLIGIEILVLLSGLETGYGAPGGQLYTYDLTTIDANVAAGTVLTINGNQLYYGEDVFFDGSAETDGAFRFQMSGGADTLIGGAGADEFNGLWGQDVMTGGGGNDAFMFRYLTESAPSAMDSITDFTAGDRINLSAIDANTGVGGNQAFAFIGASAFGNVAGQLRVSGSGTDWVVEVDVDGDGVADLAVAVTTTVSGYGFTGADFVL